MKAFLAMEGSVSVAFFLALAAAMIPSASAAWKANLGQYNRLSVGSFTHYKNYTHKRLSSWMGCGTVCNEHENCAGFAYHPADNVCQMAKEFTAGDGNEFFARKGVDGTWAGWSEWTNCSCPEGVIKQHRWRICVGPSNGGLSFCPSDGYNGTAERKCSGCSAAYQFLILGGFPGVDADVEIVDLAEEDTACNKPADMPSGVIWGMVGTVVTGDPEAPILIACGGFGYSHCFEYSFNDDLWTAASYSTSVPRGRSDSVVLANGTWILIGGQDAAEDTSDVFLGDGFALIDNEYQINRPCFAQINSSHAVSVGGICGSEYCGFSTVIIDLNNWNWTQEADCPNAHATGVCGAVNDEDVVAAGGISLDTYVDIFNLQTREWRAGTSLPHPIDKARSAQFGATFFFVGGSSSGSQYMDTIYMFDPDTYGWTQLAQRLTTTRRSHEVVPLPLGMGLCN